MATFSGIVKLLKDVIFSDLTTTSKNVIGAINELNTRTNDFISRFESTGLDKIYRSPNEMKDLPTGLYWINGYQSISNGDIMPFTDRHIMMICSGGFEGKCCNQLAINTSTGEYKIRHRDSTSVAWGTWVSH